MRIGLSAQLAVGRKHILDIEIAEDRLIGDIIVAIAEIAVDNESADGIDFELRLVLLRRIGALAIGSHIESDGELIRKFGKPRVDLSGDGRRDEGVCFVYSHTGVLGLEIVGRVEAVEDEQVEHLAHEHLLGVDDGLHLRGDGLVGARELDAEPERRVDEAVGEVEHAVDGEVGSVGG